MVELPLWSYLCPAKHEAVSHIIQERSTNSTDIREFAFAGLDLSGAREILDLGCGFGFMAEVLAERVAGNARITGIDACKMDEEAFLGRVRSSGRKGSFVPMRVEAELPWSDGRFDMIVCCYALYFFVDVLPHIARLLAPTGLFVAVTHSESSVRGQLPDAGLADAAVTLLTITCRFSAENGRDLLAPWFGDIERYDYPNTLVFDREHVDDLYAYMRFKLPLLIPGAKPTDGFPEGLTRLINEELEQRGRVVIHKNDAVFRCRRPRWQ